MVTKGVPPCTECEPALKEYTIFLSSVGLRTILHLIIIHRVKLLGLNLVLKLSFEWSFAMALSASFKVRKT